MVEPYEVVPYSHDGLLKLICEASGAASHIVGQKLHSVYFKEYFGSIGARTVVVEREYVDRDFLEDFAAYYVRCFRDYPRKCVRLHFFDCEFDAAAFGSLLSGGGGPLTAGALKEAYLGFVVVKPLPETVIGRTCLRTYDSDGGRRQFPITREYAVHLFGIPLTVRSLAFQEQDRVAAACATSALWSVFQGTGMLFHHHIPSPVEITRAATRYPLFEMRALPNSGLTPEQMALAIREVGLEPLPVRAEDEFHLKATLRAYLGGGIPVLLAVKLVQGAGTPMERVMGRHAVAATGFDLGGTTAAHPETGLLLRATRMQKLYVHDDQVGPFARVEFRRGHLTTSWRGADGAVGGAQAVPEVMLIPLYHKIRIPFQAVLDAVMAFDRFVEVVRESAPDVLVQRLEWDMHLTTVSELKKTVPDEWQPDGDYRLRLLTEPMPRFLWRATARCGSVLALELLFDATDIEQGNFFCRAVEYDVGLSSVLRTLASEPKVREAVGTRPEWRILEWFAAPGGMSAGPAAALERWNAQTDVQ